MIIMENYSETDTFYIREKRKEEILKKNCLLVTTSHNKEQLTLKINEVMKTESAGYQFLLLFFGQKSKQ